MHKLFHINDFTNFALPWFAWVNTLAGGLIVKLSKEFLKRYGTLISLSSKN